MTRVTQWFQRWAWLAAVTLASVVPFMASCSPRTVSASVSGPDLIVHAAPGDSLWVVSHWTSTGAVDSIRWTTSSPKTTSTTVNYNGVSRKDSVKVIPFPALLGGDTLVITSCVTPKINGTWGLASCKTYSYVRPGVVQDTLRVSRLDLRPTTTDLLALYPGGMKPGDTVTFCTFAVLANGQKARTSVSVGSNCDARWQQYLSEASG